MYITKLIRQSYSVFCSLSSSWNSAQKVHTTHIVVFYSILSFFQCVPFFSWIRFVFVAEFYAFIPHMNGKKEIEIFNDHLGVISAQ